MKLDLGSGLIPRDGHVGIDLFVGVDMPVAEAKPGDIVALDLQQFPWPISDASVDEVWCSHYVEHQPRAMWVPFVEELHRILVPGGKATILHPNAKSVRAHQDPTHLDIIPVERWLYVSRDYRTMYGLDHRPYPTVHFSVEASYVNIDERWMARSDEAIQFALAHYWDAAPDIVATLIKDS